MSVFIDEFDEADGRGCATFLNLLEIIPYCSGVPLCPVRSWTARWGGLTARISHSPSWAALSNPVHPLVVPQTKPPVEKPAELDNLPLQL